MLNRDLLHESGGEFPLSLRRHEETLRERRRTAVAALVETAAAVVLGPGELAAAVD